MSEVAWTSLLPGDLVFGADREEWEVTRVDTDRAGVTGVVLRQVATGVEWTGVPGARTVHRTTRAVEVTARAHAAAQDGLGARVVAVKPAGTGVHQCPTVYPDPGSLLAHLHVFHQVPVAGIPVPDQHLAALRTRHTGLHQATPVTGVAHEHDPTFYETLQEAL